LFLKSHSVCAAPERRRRDDAVPARYAAARAFFATAFATRRHARYGVVLAFMMRSVPPPRCANATRGAAKTQRAASGESGAVRALCCRTESVEMMREENCREKSNAASHDVSRYRHVAASAKDPFSARELRRAPIRRSAKRRASPAAPNIALPPNDAHRSDAPNIADDQERRARCWRLQCFSARCRTSRDRDAQPSRAEDIQFF